MAYELSTRVQSQRLSPHRKRTGKAERSKSLLLVLRPTEWTPDGLNGIRQLFLKLRAQQSGTVQEETYWQRGSRKGKPITKNGTPVLQSAEYWRIPLNEKNLYLPTIAKLQDKGISLSDVYYGNDGEFGTVGMHGTGTGEKTRINYAAEKWRDMERDGMHDGQDFLTFVYGSCWQTGIPGDSLQQFAITVYGQSLPANWTESAQFWLDGLKTWNKLESVHERYAGEQIALDPSSEYWLIVWSKIQDWNARKEEKTANLEALTGRKIPEIPAFIPNRKNRTAENSGGIDNRSGTYAEQHKLNWGGIARTERENIKVESPGHYNTSKHSPAWNRFLIFAEWFGVNPSPAYCPQIGGDWEY